MEEFKNLTTEQLKKVVEEINKELCERRKKERQNAYENLINAMKDFQEAGFLTTDTCYITVRCEECEYETDIDFFDFFDLVIEELERGL